jgi:H+/gluconate symporter-like permease
MIFIITLIVIILILYLYKKLSTESFQDSILDTTDTTDTTTKTEFFGTYMKRALLYIFLFILLTVNLIALSVSLQCNKESNIFYKIASGLFAFMFGILYLIFNYYMYRVKVNNKPCVICKDNVFGLSTSE